MYERLCVARPGLQGCFWRTLSGAEIDLLLDRGDARVAIEIKAGRGDRREVRRGAARYNGLPFRSRIPHGT